MNDSWLQRLAKIGVLPQDSEEEILRKTILTLTAGLVNPAAVLWGIMYGWMGFWRSAAIPLGYAVASLMSLMMYARTKQFGWFRFSQLFLILWLPFLLQWSLGGFAASSGVMIWAILAPLGALMFHGTRPALAWMAAYLGLAMVSGLLDQFGVTSPVEIASGLRVIFFVMNLGTVSLIVFLMVRYFVREKELAMDALRVEQGKSESLLLNILPKAIADRLKGQHQVIADGFEEVTILFADIVQFTRLSERVSPRDLVAMLNRVFSAFDQLVERHQLEKIKTIGDAYMVVGGLPTHRKDHAEAVAEMALDMQRELQRLSVELQIPLAARIGINTGPVVAGVIGTKKFLYDLWGDAVNTASRMESHGLGGVIQVTETTYQRLRATYQLKKRGVVQIKGKGPMTTYLLLGSRKVPVSIS